MGRRGGEGAFAAWARVLGQTKRAEKAEGERRGVEPPSDRRAPSGAPPWRPSARSSARLRADRSSPSGSRRSGPERVGRDSGEVRNDNDRRRLRLPFFVVRARRRCAARATRDGRRLAAAPGSPTSGARPRPERRGRVWTRRGPLGIGRRGVGTRRPRAPARPSPRDPPHAPGLVPDARAPDVHAPWRARVPDPGRPRAPPRDRARVPDLPGALHGPPPALARGRLPRGRPRVFRMPTRVRPRLRARPDLVRPQRQAQQRRPEHVRGHARGGEENHARRVRGVGGGDAAGAFVALADEPCAAPPRNSRRASARDQWLVEQVERSARNPKNTPVFASVQGGADERYGDEARKRREAPEPRRAGGHRKPAAGWRRRVGARGRASGASERERVAAAGARVVEFSVGGGGRRAPALSARRFSARRSSLFPRVSRGTSRVSVRRRRRCG